MSDEPERCGAPWGAIFGGLMVALVALQIAAEWFWPIR